MERKIQTSKSADIQKQSKEEEKETNQKHLAEKTETAVDRDQNIYCYI